MDGTDDDPLDDRAPADDRTRHAIDADDDPLDDRAPADDRTRHAIDADDDPLDDPAWRAHLFAVRSEEEVGAWARSLRWFRFCRALPSPFLAEPDRLVVVLAWRDRADLAGLLDRLGLPPAAAARPAWHDVEGHRVRAHVTPGRLELAVSGAEQRRLPVTDHDVEAARHLEEVLFERAGPPADLADLVVDPPLDDRSCVSPHRYARLFDGHR